MILADIDWSSFVSSVFVFDDYGELLALVRNSLWAGAVLGLVGGVVGTFVMMRDLAFAVHGIAELSFAGAAAALLIGTSGSILWWQGQQMLDNYTSIRQQKDALEKLNARTWGVRYQEDSQGRFLVLPEGVKADTNWTFDNGRKNGIRLVQE